MLYVMDHVLVRGHESADGRHGLAVGSHNDVHFLLKSEVLCRAASRLAQHADTVRVIHHEPGTVFFAKLHDARKRSDVPFHAVYAVHNDEFAPVPTLLEDELEAAHVAVFELLDLSK